MLDGAFALDKAGTGSLTLSAANTYSGATTVSAGKLVASNSAALGSALAGTSVASGATLEIDNLGIGTEPLSLSGLGLGGGGALLGSGANAAAGGTVSLLADSRIVSSGALALSGVVSGGFALDKAGAGSLTLSAANSYSGATTVSAGTLVASHASALGTAAGGTSVASGATLEVNNVNLGNEALSLAGTGVAGVGALVGTGANAAAGGAISLTADSRIGGAGALLLSGPVSGGFALDKAGAGSLGLSGANSYSGATTVTAGTLVAGHATALGTVAGGTTVLAGATLEINNVNLGNEALSLAGDGLSGVGALVGRGTAALGGAVTLAADASVGVPGSLVLAGAIGQSGGARALTKIDTGTLTLTGNGSYAGGTTVAAGTLAVSGAGAAGTGTIAVGGQSLQIDNGATVLNAVTLAGGSISNSAGQGTLAGLTTLSADSLLQSSGVGASLVVTGAITGTGALTTQGGFISLLGNNSYSGATRVAAGTLTLQNGQAVPDGSALTLANGTALTLVSNETIGSLAGAATGGTQVQLGNHVLSTGADNSATTFGGVIGGVGGQLVKQGSGNFTLEGTGSYSGGTSVAAGTLTLNTAQAVAGTGTIAVGGNRLNLDNGAVATNAVTLAGGTLGNVAGAGSLTGPLTLAANALLDSSASGTGLAVSGAISGNGGLTVQAGQVTLSGANTYGGNTAVATGELRLQGGAALPDGSAVTLADGAVLTLLGNETIGSLSGVGAPSARVHLDSFALTTGGNGGSTRFDGVLDGVGGQLSKTGGGSFTLSGANTYSGATRVLGGTLAFAASNVIADASAVTVDAATLDIGVHSDTVAAVSLQGGGAINGSSGVLTSSAAFDLRSGTVSAILDGTAGAIKSSAGAVTLSGANLLRGSTLVQAGLLQLQGGQAIHDNALVTLADGASLALLSSETLGALSGAGATSASVNLGASTLTTGGNGASSAFDGVIAGAAGRLVKAGAGNFTLTGANTYGGGTRIDDGVLTVSGLAATAGSGAIAVGANRLNIDNNASVANALTLAGGTLGNAAGAGRMAGPVSLTANARLDSSGGSGLLVSGPISGSAGISVQAGQVTLGGANTYSGATAVAAGELRLQGGAALPDASALTLADGAALTLQSSETIGSLAGVGATAARVHLNANLLTTGGNGGNTRFDGVIDGTGGQLTKTGGGTFTLSGSNSYSGATLVAGGTLALAASDVIADASALTVNAATLDIGAHSDTVASVSLQGGGVVNGSGGVLTSLAAFDLRSGTVSAILGGTAGAIKTSTDSVTLSGVNRYTGTTFVNAGTLQLQGAGRLAAAGSVNVAAAGSLALAGDQSLDSLTLAGSLTGSGTLLANSFAINGGRIDVPLGTRTLDSSGNSAINANAAADTITINSGNLTLGAGNLLSDNAQVTVAAPATLTMAGADTVGSLTLLGTLAGTGTLTAQTYALVGGTANANLGSGALTSLGASALNGSAAVSTLAVQGGTLGLGAANRLNALPAVTVAAGATLALGGAERIGSLAGGGTLALGAATLSTGVGGTTRFDGVISGSGGLTKQGGGSFTLGGANTYSGDTLVEAGSLALASADRLADATAVTVASGASLNIAATDSVRSLVLAGTLDGAGTLTAASYSLRSGTVNAGLGVGALLSSGSSTLAGTAAVGSLVVNGGSLGLASAGRLTATPAVTLDAGANLALGGNETLGTLAGGGTLALGGATLSTGVAGSSAFAGVLSGSGGLTKQGSGSFTLSGANSYTGATTVAAGTLLLAGAERLADSSAVTVASGATLSLDAAETVATLLLRGTLAGSGTLSAASYTLDGGNAIANLGAGALVSTGNSTLVGSSAAGTVNVNTGRLTLGSANRLADTSQVTVATGAALTLAGDDGVASLALGGTLDGAGTLTAATYLLAGGTADAALGAGKLNSSGASRLNATANASSLAVDTGTLTLGSANRLLGAPAVTLAAGSRLLLGGDDSFGSLAGAGSVGLGAATLSTGAAGSTTFSGVIDGSGGLVKQGAATTFGLTGANAFTGPTQVAAGTLVIGDGASSGAMATSDYRVDGVLRLQRGDAVLLAQPISGSGAVEQAGGANGVLTMQGNNKTYTGATRVVSGRLATAGAENLSDVSAVQVAVGAALSLAGDETVKAVDADGTLAIASKLTTTGAMALKGAVTATGGAAVSLSASQIDSVNPGNRWGSSLSVNSSGAVNLSAGTHDGSAAAPLRDLSLGAFSVAGGGKITAGAIELTALTNINGGTLLLDASKGAIFVLPDASLTGKLTPDSRQIAFTKDIVTQTAASRIEVAGDGQLALAASQGGSVALLSETNNFGGKGLSVLSGPAGVAWAANRQKDPANAASIDYSLQNQVRLVGRQVVVGVGGIEADVVAIKADALATLGSAAIVAKLPYDNLVGTTISLPGLTLALSEAAFAATFSFGQPTGAININVGSKAFGNRTSLPVDSGFVALLPKNGAKGTTAVYLQGPLVAGTYGFFYDGSGVQTEVPVFYNGSTAVTPQVQGSISSTVSVSESARKERFEEAVRTENVAVRLRAGVIAEVGPGTPATSTSGSLDKMRPPRCEPQGGTLACSNAGPTP